MIFLGLALGFRRNSAPGPGGVRCFRCGLRELSPSSLVPRLRRAAGLASVLIELLQHVEDPDDESLLRF